MALQTYYFLFSLIFVLITLLHIVNMLFFKVKGVTLIGNNYKAGTLERRRLEVASSSKWLKVAISIATVFEVNFVFCVWLLWQKGNHSSVKFLYIFGPLLVLFIASISFFYTRASFGDNKLSNRNKKQ